MGGQQVDRQVLWLIHWSRTCFCNELTSCLKRTFFNQYSRK